MKKQVNAILRGLKEKIRKWYRQKTRLIVVAGRKKSGKDVLVDYIMKRYHGFKHYRIAEAPINALLRPVLGKSAYMRRVSILLEREKPKFAIVEAIRTKEEYEEFVVNRRGILMGVMADGKIRYERALQDSRTQKEKRDEGKMTFKEFMQKENSPIERDADWIVKRAHFVLENNFKTKIPFEREIDKVMTELGFTRKARRAA